MIRRYNAIGKRVIAALIIILPVQLPVCAESNESPADRLKRAIRLFELRTDHKEEKAPLAFGHSPQDVDINSVIRVDVDSSRLLGAAPDPAGPVAPEVEHLSELVNRLSQMIGPLGNAFNEAKRLTELAAAGDRSSNEFTALATSSKTTQEQFLKAIIKYSEWLKQSPEVRYVERGDYVERRASEATRKAATLMSQGTGTAGVVAPFAAVVRDEVLWVNSELKRIGGQVRKSLEAVALVLVARAFVDSRSPERIHIDHFDPLPPGAIVAFDKINWAGDSVEARRMLDAIRPVVDTLRKLKTNRSDLRSAITDLLNANGIDVDSFILSVEQLVAALKALRDTDWLAEAKTLLDKIESELRQSGVVGDKKKTLEEMRNQARSLRDQLRDARDRWQAMEGNLSAFSLQDVLEEAQEQADPVDALLAVMNGIDRAARTVSLWKDAVDKLRDDIKLFKDAVGGAKTLIEDLKKGVAALSGRTERELRKQIDRFAGAKLDTLVVAVEGVRREAETVGKGLRSLTVDDAKQILLYAQSELPIPEDIYYVLGTRIKDTFVDLRTVRSRKEGTAVTLEARLYRVNEAEPGIAETSSESVGVVRIGEELDAERQTFVLRRFGWYSAPNVSVAYAGASRPIGSQSEATREFTVQMSWLFRLRPWIKNSSSITPVVYRKRWWHNIGYGLHIITLDLDRNSQQEIGLGATISVASDFLQLGYGVDLSLNEETYWFVGVRLFQFGKSLGIADVPDTGNE
jgi:hypothetical protein